MTIETRKNNETLTIIVAGRLDTSTAPQLEKVVDEEVKDIQQLVMDFADLEYVSSAGLRVILRAQKKMNILGGMKICNVNEMIMEVFEITGFADILNIE